MQKPWYNLTIAEAWGIFLDHCPVKVDLRAARNLAAFAFGAVAVLTDRAIAALPGREVQQLRGQEPIGLLPESVLIPQNRPRKPWATRSAQLNHAIAAAWRAGYNTYDAAIGFVRATTGKGCSRRAIARWKASQGA